MPGLPPDIDDRIEQLWCIGSTRKIAELIGVDRGTVNRRAKKLGLSPFRHHWQPEEDAILREMYSTNCAAAIAERIGVSATSVYRRAAKLGLCKDPDWWREQARRAALNNGQRGRFPKGMVPWNKGIRCTGLGGNTRFRPGNRPHTWRPIGAERISKDGILQRKVTDDGPAYKHFRSVHAMLWEEANGPVPHGHVVVFRDGNKRRIELDNLELVRRSDLMRRNTVHRYPEELKQAIRAKARLSRAINERLKHEKSHDRSAQSSVCNAGGASGRRKADGHRAREDDL